MSVSKPKSSASTSTSNKNYSQPITLQDVDGISVVGNAAPVSVDVLDGGAIGGMRDVSLAGLDTASALTMAVLEQQNVAARDALGFAERAGEQAMNFAFDAGRPEAATLKQSGNVLMVVGGILAAAMLVKAGK